MIKLNQITIVLMFFTIFTSTKTLRAESETESIIKQVGQTLSLLQDYQVTIKAEVITTTSGGSGRSSSTTRLTVKENKQNKDILINEKNNGHCRYITTFDGRYIWNYDIRARIVRKVEYFSMPETIKKKLNKKNSHGFILSSKAEFGLKTQWVKGKKYFLLYILKPFEEAGQIYEKLEILIDGDTYLFVERKSVVKQRFPGSRDEKNIAIIETTLKYSNWKTGTGIKDYEFAFEIPPGVQVKDVTEESIRYMESLLQDQETNE